jgi:hypothetical protein
VDAPLRLTGRRSGRRPAPTEEQQWLKPLHCTACSR